MASRRPCRVISVYNAKGGTGKTTTVINLADALHELGNRVLVVDMDTQANLTSYFGSDTEHVTTVSDILTSSLPIKPELVAEALERHDFCDLLRGDAKLVAVEAMAASYENVHWCLKFALEHVKGDYDYVLVDCPPTRAVLSRAALIASDWLIVPFDSSEAALTGYEKQVSDFVMSIKLNPNFNPSLRVLGLLACNMNLQLVNTRITLAKLAALAKASGTVVFSQPIRSNVRVSEAVRQRKSLLSWQPDCNGAMDYRALAAEVESLVESA